MYMHLKKSIIKRNLNLVKLYFIGSEWSEDMKVHGWGVSYDSSHVTHNEKLGWAFTSSRSVWSSIGMCIVHLLTYCLFLYSIVHYTHYTGITIAFLFTQYTCASLNERIFIEKLAKCYFGRILQNIKKII